MSDSNGGKQVPNDEQGQLKWTPNPDDPFTDCSNAIRQMLFHVEPLRNYFLQHIFLGGQHADIGNLFQSMILQQSDKSNKARIEVVLNSSSGAFAAQVDELIQVQDYADSSFADAWEMLHAQLELVKREAHESIEAPEQTEFSGAEEAWLYFTAHKNNTILANLFLIQFRLFFNYLECGHQYTKWTYLYNLVFEFDNSASTIADFIAMFPHNDVEHATNSCSKCIEPWYQPCAFQYAITRWPPYLFIQLQRFDREETNNKITTPIKVQVRIQPPEWQGYQLHSAILHKGYSTQKGHYSTLVRHGNDKWSLFLGTTTIKNLSNSLAEIMLTKFAYILLYQLEAGKSEPKQPKVDPAASPKKKVPGDTAEEQMAQILRGIKKPLLDECDIKAMQKQCQASGGLRKHPYCGLENRRLVCYSNSVLQALYTCSRIRQYLMKSAELGEFHRLLANLFNAMHNQSGSKCKAPAINPESSFNEHFRKKRPEFRVDAMHDAQEYLTILVDLVHEEANAARANRHRRPKEVPNFTDATSQWAYHRAFVDDSKLASLLVGQIESTLTCLTCQHLSHSWTAIWQLQLQLQTESKSLAECLKEFTSKETLKDNSAPTCPRCSTRQACTKQQQICRLPPYLVIHLERFLATGKKIDQALAIESSLSLCGRSLELCNVICHKGSETNGHYYTMVREDEQHWTQLDDDIIRGPLAGEEAEEKLRSSAYICIYEVIDEKAH